MTGTVPRPEVRRTEVPGASSPDAFATAIVERQLRMVVREMGIVLLRSARSPVFHQAQDFATAAFDAHGGLLAQGDHIPLLAVALGPGLRAVMVSFGEGGPASAAARPGSTTAIADGDVFVHNDVFDGGNQLSDIAVYMPVFVGDELVGWVGCKGHQADIGGAVRGGVNPNAREVWQEGLRIPPVKLVDGGRLRQDVWAMLVANVRLAEVVSHDLRAQLGSCAVGAQGLCELVQRYGPEQYRRHIRALLDSSERMTRDWIATIPDGVHSAAAVKVMPGGVGSVRIALTVTVRGDDLEVDASASDPQTATYVNAPPATSAAAIVLALRMLGAGDVALNEGMLRAIRLIIADGTVLGASYPAATAYGNHLTDQIAMALFAALAPAIPKRVPADWNPLYGSYVSGADRSGREFHDVLFLANKGGSGAVEGADGCDHIGSIEACGTIRSADYELFELHNPLTLLQHEYDPDSAGAGRWRGGLGVVTRLRFEGPATDLVLYGDGLQQGAAGRFGGHRGSPNSGRLSGSDGSQRTTASSDVVVGIAPGTILEKRAGGGGGYGDPKLRDRDAVRRDVRDGVVSARVAARVYGLEIGSGENDTSDEEST